MTLRARLAIALAVLAALSVVALAVIDYTTTDQGLRQEVDSTLVGSARALPGADDVCRELAEMGEGSIVVLNGPLSPLRDRIAQCISASGQVQVRLAPSGQSFASPGVDVTPRPSLPDLAAGEPPPHGNGYVSSPWTQTFGGQPYRVVAIPRLSGGYLVIGRSMAETNHVLASVRNRSILLGLVIIALAAVAGVLIARRTTQPVTRLSAAADEIAASGRLDIEVPPGGRDEIGRLSRAFASMLAALTRSREQQQRLVQDAGHELRTPLTSLRANIDTLRRHPDLEAATRGRVLADLDGELRELSSLVEELVAEAVDARDDEPEQRLAFDRLVERAVDRALRRSGRTILLDARPATVLGRPQQLLRAVGNLLDNAVKFSPEGTPIEVTVRPGRLEVRDHGPGMADDDLPRVFDRFHRAVEARSLPGSGLGLAIVRQIVEDAGGTVTAANHPEGGAIFTVELPPADPGPPAGSPPGGPAGPAPAHS
ncbi:MAG TPA: ATP-binding protein [Actinomycetota bacterium]|jgi:two-component system sensor histidine kinase MprB|nr:ATP-binding protein [Actinomycetota bacterium]